MMRILSILTEPNARFPYVETVHFSETFLGIWQKKIRNSLISKFGLLISFKSKLILGLREIDSAGLGYIHWICYF